MPPKVQNNSEEEVSSSSGLNQTEDSLYNKVFGPSDDASSTAETSSSTESGDKLADGSDTQSRTQQQETPPKERPVDERLPEDKDGNLVDKDGKIVARAGTERRAFEENKRLKKTLGNANEQYKKLYGIAQRLGTELQTLREANSTSRELGLTPEENIQAARLMASYKENPAAAIKYILTEAQANGHDLSDLLQGGTDVAAIGQMIDSRLKPIVDPIRQRQEHDAQLEQINATVTRQIEAFYSKYEDAIPFEGILAGMIQRDPSLTPTEAWLTLRDYAHRNGIDLSQGPEVFQQRQGQEQRAPRRSPTGGRSGQPANARNTDTRRVMQDSGDIVRQAMREAGLSVDHL